ncbi:unnamed protein product [Schistosoma haematobium]|nr:unnamed protein product [Schistosoma haematobium]CAH8679387.1 unnamed protein product [Schistosoma haematobium]
MSCRRRSHTTPGYLQPRTLDDRIRDDYRYNYRGSRYSRRYQPNYDDFYARPPSVYQPVEPYYPRPRESYYVRPPSVYQPTETLYPGPMPNSYQRHSYAQPVSYQPVYPSYREDVYAPSTYSSYPRRRSMSNNPLIDPELTSESYSIVCLSKQCILCVKVSYQFYYCQCFELTMNVRFMRFLRY